LLQLLSDKSHTKLIGDQAKHYIESQAGATKRCFQAIAKDLSEET
jgi:hypothetical protein